MEEKQKYPFFKKFFDSTLSYFFPPLCLHCKEPLPPNLFLLCSSCLNDLELIDILDRCLVCFESQEIGPRMKCGECSNCCDFFASCFSFQGVIKTLLHLIRDRASTHLIDTLAAFMVIQFQKLEWTIPDIIVSPPQSSLLTLRSGFNANKDLGISFAKFLSVPYIPLLKFNQNHLLHGKNHNNITLKIKNGVDIVDKKILLVDYVRSKDDIFSNCALELRTGKPKQIYGLTICF